MMGLSGMEMGALMFALLLVMLALRIHIGIAMLLTGSIGYTVVAGIDPLLNYFKEPRTRATPFMTFPWCPYFC